MPGKLEFFSTDFCPFAQRAWIALLEKEVDVKNPQHFDYQEVNYFNPNLDLTKRFWEVSKTVPAGIIDGQQWKESMPMVYQIDATWPENPLQPSTAEGKARMEALIAKYTSGEFDIPGTLGAAMFGPSEIAKVEALPKLLAIYKELNKEFAIAESEPYLMGKQFTIADIALFPHTERAVVVLGHYKGWKLPTEGEEYRYVNRWIEACAKRPSVATTTADRLPRSMAVQPFAEKLRAKYLCEVAEPYIHGVREESRVQLRDAKPGKRTINIEDALRDKGVKDMAAASSASAASMGAGAGVAK